MRITTRALAVAALAALTSCGSGSLPLLPSARGAAGAADSRTSEMMAPFQSVRYSLSKDFKAELPERAKAYELSESTNEAAVARFAKALGIEGKVVTTKEAWTVSSQGRSFRVSKAGGLPFALDGEAFASSGYACADPARPADDTADATAGQTGAEPAGAPGDSTPSKEPGCAAPPPNPDLPTKEAAERIARKALIDGGLSLDGAKVVVDGGYESWSVNVTHRVGEITIGALTTSVLVGPKGKITTASGLLGQPKSLGDYPLISAQKAVDRLNASQSAGPVPLDGREPAIGTDQLGERESSASPVVPGPDVCDDAAPNCAPPIVDPPIKPETVEIELTGASAALLAVGGYEPGVAMHLVPAYSFTSPDGGDVLVESVTDENLGRGAPTDGDTKPPADDGTEPDGSGGGSTGGGEQLRSGTDGESCSVQMPTPAPNKDGSVNAPVELEVCVNDGKVKVGDEVTFTIKAKDADGSFADGPCETPVSATFGDETDDGGTARCMACAKATEGQRTYETIMKHTYDKPGNYQVVFNVHSGSTCEPRPGDSKGEISIAVTVTR